MKSRMDKYQGVEKNKYERSSKNTKLYEEVYDDIYKDTTYKNMEVIDSAKEINLNRLKNMLDDKYDTRQYRTFKNYSVEDVDIDDKPTFVNERKVSYDINDVINEAKEKRSFIEEAREKQKYINFSNARNDKKDEEYKKMQQEEKELEELINTMTIPKQDTTDALDIFSELKGSENTVVTKPIDSSYETSDNSIKEKTSTEDIRHDLEKTLVKADKTFYTDSNMFTKGDFEDFSTLNMELKKSSKLKKAFIIIFVLLILGGITYFVLTNYVLKK